MLQCQSDWWSHVVITSSVCNFYLTMWHVNNFDPFLCAINSHHSNSNLFDTRSPDTPTTYLYFCPTVVISKASLSIAVFHLFGLSLEGCLRNFNLLISLTWGKKKFWTFFWKDNDVLVYISIKAKTTLGCSIGVDDFLIASLLWCCEEVGWRGY